ncbi:MAG: response regulator [Candidatus Manganitrophus sp.]|nr:response regulator [Candidatus Manganitrophus sp.]
MGTDVTKPLQVLVVEDSAEDAELLIDALRRGNYDPTYERVETPEAMTAALDRQRWDIVFGDYSMPHFDGVSALNLLRKRGWISRSFSSPERSARTPRWIRCGTGRTTMS